MHGNPSTAVDVRRILPHHALGARARQVVGEQALPAHRRSVQCRKARREDRADLVRVASQQAAHLKFWPVALLSRAGVPGGAAAYDHCAAVASALVLVALGSPGSVGYERAEPGRALVLQLGLCAAKLRRGRARGGAGPAWPRPSLHVVKLCDEPLYVVIDAQASGQRGPALRAFSLPRSDGLLPRQDTKQGIVLGVE